MLFLIREIRDNIVVAISFVSSLYYRVFVVSSVDLCVIGG